jgi:3-oxoadipate CoA-transferase, beta subunit
MSEQARNAIARRAAWQLPDGAYVNLGIGLPTLVANHIPPDREIIFHSENGLLGLGPAPDESNFDPEMINAGKAPVTLLKGGAIFHHNDAFLMIRGGHLDYALLGAFQVSSRGDLANWATLGNNKAPAVGGAMDLAAGAREVWALMEHVTRTGEPRILDTCTYPLTAAGVVTRIFTDLATITIDDGLIVEEMAQGVSFDYLQSVTGAPLRRR